MNQFFKITHKEWKSMLLTETDIMLVNKSYNNAEEFLEKFHEKGMLKSRREIAIFDINKVSSPGETSNTATITIPKRDSDEDVELVFESEEEQAQFVKTVIKPRNLQPNEQQVSVWKAISSPVIGLAFTGFFGWIVYEDALIIEQGGEVDTSGRRTLYKKLFAWLGETVGSQGAIIAASAIGLLCIYFIYKNLKQRPVQIVYQ